MRCGTTDAVEGNVSIEGLGTYVTHTHAHTEPTSPAHAHTHTHTHTQVSLHS